jgi:hypothetical protein
MCLGASLELGLEFAAARRSRHCPALPFLLPPAEGAHEGNLPAGLPDGVDVLGGVLQMPAVASVNIRLAGAAALATGDGGARSSFFCTCN